MDQNTLFYTPTPLDEGKEMNKIKDPYQLACNALQLSSIPAHLPCREKERKDVMDFIRAGVESGGSGCAMYISGLPGTGKTATVREVILSLKNECLEGKIPTFQVFLYNTNSILKLME